MAVAKPAVQPSARTFAGLRVTLPAVHPLVFGREPKGERLSREDVAAFCRDAACIGERGEPLKTEEGLPSKLTLGTIREVVEARDGGFIVVLVNGFLAGGTLPPAAAPAGKAPKDAPRVERGR